MHRLSVDLRNGLLIIGVLLGAYLLIYVPAPASADGKAMLAVASSLARRGTFDMDAVRATDTLLVPQARIGKNGVDGALYAKKGPTTSLAMLPLVWLADKLPFLPIRATAMLLNSLVNVLTAMLLYAFVRRLAFRPATALLVALIFGLATLAIVYVKDLFGEPLAGLLLLAALLLADRYRADGRTRDLLGCAAALALIVGINLLYLTLAPVVALYLFLGARRLRPLVIFAAPFVVVGVTLLTYNLVRFGSPLETGYHFAQGDGFTRPIPAGLFGLFLSPYRGAFLYIPVLWLALPGTLQFLRARRRLTLTILGLIAVQAVGMAGWWSWHGGILWGPRFLLPVLPLAMLLIAPVVEAAWSNRALRVVVAAAALISFGVQLLGALFSYFPYYRYLYANFQVPDFTALAADLADTVVYDPTQSPILGHLALALNGWPLEPAWAANGDPLHLGAGLGLIGIGLCAGLLPVRRFWIAVTLAASLAAMVLVVSRQPTGAIPALQTALDPPGTVFAATLAFDDGLLDLKGRSRVITSSAPTSPDDPTARAVWELTRREARYLWFVSWFGPGDPANWQARDLWQGAAFVREVRIADHRALLFRQDAPSAAESAGNGWQFGSDHRLVAYAIRRAEDGVYVSLRWQGAENRPWFVHLLGMDGQIVAQQDRIAQDGYADFRAGPVEDRLYFIAGQPDAMTAIRVGVLGPDGRPLSVVGPDGLPLADPFVVIPF